MTAARKRAPGRGHAVQGNDLLYHYFQKTLLEENPEQFRHVVRGLILGLAVWLPPAAYERFPLLVPYALRDAACRGDRRRGIPDQWGAPDLYGRFRDDNSLIKGIPRSLIVTNPSNSLLNGKRLGTGFVAAHVWRKLSDGTDAPRNELTYSFLPNLVWLPSQLAKLSDREGGYAQTFLQAQSLALYRHLPLTSKLARFVAPIWDLLPVREEVAAIDVAVDRVSFFQSSEPWLLRRRRTLKVVREALIATADRTTFGEKIVASRYGDGLRRFQPTSVRVLLEMLTKYSEAVDEAAGSQVSELRSST